MALAGDFGGQRGVEIGRSDTQERRRMTAILKMPVPNRMATLLRLNEQMQACLEDIENRGRAFALFLKEVVDGELWRETHLTFTAYFTQTFKRHRNRAGQLLAWAK